MKKSLSVSYTDDGFIVVEIEGDNSVLELEMTAADAEDLCREIQEAISCIIQEQMS